ncbi:MAG: DNA-processing protein DprA [Clostridia bacterium]
MKTKIIKCFEEGYPKRLLDIKNYPQQLYCMGNTKLLNHKKTIAIVGSRNCSEYGRKYARIFARELAKYDICVISGLAKGIDAAAHYGAVTEIGSTIAVLGGGLKNIYPSENVWLFNQILQEGGTIITEYEEQEETKMSNFPIRNRIISAMADGVLVIEAEHRSGSRITAKYAKEQGKKVYCIPINLDAKNSSGIIDLINDNAKIVTSPSKLMNDLFTDNEIEAQLTIKEKTKCREIKTENKKDDIEKTLQIPIEQKEILELLKDKKMSIEEIKLNLNRSISEINSILTLMEIEGLIKQTGGNNFCKI